MAKVDSNIANDNLNFKRVKSNFTCMNTNFEYISVAEMLKYIAGHDKAASLNTDLTILRETVVDPVSASKFYIGKFRCYFEQLESGKYTVTCPGLRIFYEPLCKKTIDKMASRYDRRIDANHKEVEGTDVSYIFVGSYAGVVGYWYFDERTGARRIYLYHPTSEKSYILKFDSVLKFLVDEDGVEHCVQAVYIPSTIERLSAPVAETTEVSKESPLNKLNVKAMMKNIMDSIAKMVGKKNVEATREDANREIAHKLTEWIASQKPLDPEDARILEENLWELVGESDKETKDEA